MKTKMVYMAVLFAGLLCLVQSARSSCPPNSPEYALTNGYSTVYEDRAGYEAGPLNAYWDGGALGTDLTGPVADIALLQAITTDNFTFDLLPETNKYWNGTSGTNFWQNGAGDGGKYLEQLLFRGRTLTGVESNVLFAFTINSNTLDTNRYDVEAYIKVVDVSDGTAFIETNLVITGVTSGQYTLDLPVTNPEIWAPAPLQAGFRVLGTNANPANAASYGGVNVTVDVICPPDPIPPYPDPMTWEVEPYTISDDKIGMTATTATDISGVEYVFQRISGGIEVVTNDSPHYVATGLSPNTFYSWRVRAQDLSVSQNATVFSPILGATTLAADTTAPLPDPAEIALITASSNSVSLMATPATDASAVEYNFVPTGTNGNASGWQSSNEYIDYGLTPETTCEYTVQVRDLSAATNMTAISAPASIALTLTPQLGISIIASDGVTATLQWQSVSGELYTIQYKTDLEAATWVDDPANTDIPGIADVMSTTSTVAGDEVFYRLEITGGP